MAGEKYRISFIAGSDPASTRSPAPKRKLLPSAFNAFGTLVILLILFGVCLGRIGPGINYAPHSAAMQTARAIALAMFGYANDNNGNYPEGNSSTEAFQKLIDGRYVGDPGIFYIPLPGKTKALSGQKLKAENVCFDITSGVDAGDPDEVPLVFMTGYKITYAPDGLVIPLIKPYPPFWTRTWEGWWAKRKMTENCAKKLQVVTIPFRRV